MLLKEKVYSQLAYLVKKIRFLEAILVSGLSLYISFLSKNAATRIFNEKKLGQARSIDLAYSMVETEYIFHCEEDWEFYVGEFIEQSISILKTTPDNAQSQNSKHENPTTKFRVYDQPHFNSSVF